MPEAVFIVLLIGFPLLGAFSRRWAALLVPLAGWPLFYVGLDKGWWLYGTGDGWERAAVSFTIVGVLSTALATAVGRGLGSRGQATGGRSR